MRLLVNLTSDFLVRWQTADNEGLVSCALEAKQLWKGKSHTGISLSLSSDYILCSQLDCIFLSKNTGILFSPAPFIFILSACSNRFEI